MTEPVLHREVFPAKLRFGPHKGPYGEWIPFSTAKPWMRQADVDFELDPQQLHDSRIPEAVRGTARWVVAESDEVSDLFHGCMVKRISLSPKVDRPAPKAAPLGVVSGDPK